MVPQDIPTQVRAALQFLASDTRCSDIERAAVRDFSDKASDATLLRLRALLR